MPNFETPADEVAAWQEKLDAEGCKINWRFTIADERIKLKRLYPSILE